MISFGHKPLTRLSLSSCLSQVDFPTSSFEVRFSTPSPADFCPQYDFSRLDTISQIQLQDVLHKKAVFWSDTHVTCVVRVTSEKRPEGPHVSLPVQVDGGGQASSLGEEGLLSVRECGASSGAGQRPLLGVVLPAGHLRLAEPVGLPGSPGRPGTPPRLVRPTPSSPVPSH